MRGPFRMNPVLVVLLVFFASSELGLRYGQDFASLQSAQSEGGELKEIQRSPADCLSFLLAPSLQTSLRSPPTKNPTLFALDFFGRDDRI